MCAVGDPVQEYDQTCTSVIYLLPKVTECRDSIPVGGGDGVVLVRMRFTACNRRTTALPHYVGEAMATTPRRQSVEIGVVSGPTASAGSAGKG
ncbi:Hypp9408 [Branchiostoma lanceolatum]|uniref:Hypp9408 protein n=1 Tax=Branchiostoma lanceolatum TaxID=7740 RepID=A0A8S4MLP7_BRALA|nr:Hypp9408 [Branchiostoma lanceolatum]